MNIGRLLRTVRYLKPRQIWYQVWRRVQKGLEAHPKCGDGELPEFTFLNLTAKPKGWNDKSLDMLWRYNLHYFDYVDGHEGLVKRWIAENPKGSVPGWDPYPTSLRIVNWIKYADELAEQCNLKETIAEQVAWLAKHVEWHIMANHLMANLKALVIGYRWLGRDYAKWMRLYKRQIDEQVLPDGGHFERSVMYHAIMLEDVLDVIRFCGTDAEWLRPVATRMLKYLVNMTGPDGRIAMFNDAADGIAKSTKWLCGYAESLGIEVPVAETFADFPDTGYTRMTAGDFVLFVDTAPIGPDYQPGHAHADTLTYELYYDGRKIITDVGTSEYRGSRRAYERSTAAHNVVEVDGRNSSEVWGSHRVGARARIVEREVVPGRICAGHDGYGFKVEREMWLTQNGLKVLDKFLGHGECVTRVHLCVTLETGGLRFDGFDEVKEYEYAVEFGKLEKGVCLQRHFNSENESFYNICLTN